ncbi:tRNA dihydrouridine synthase DusB, partial [Limosilactobacillus reuteri]
LRRGIMYHNQRTLNMMDVDPEEHPMGIQIFGGTKETLVEAAKYVDQHTAADVIDINMGCPVNKVVKTDAGARWLLDPNKVYEMVSYVTDAVKKPVTVKMRTGWDDKHILAVENALAAERAGASAIAMHGRTRKQMYTGQADWNILKEVASQLKIPFMANGDVKTPEDAKKILDMTGATAAMIGRAAMGNPWMLKRTEHYLATGELLPEATPEQKIEMAKDHLNRLVDLKGEYVGVREFRGLSTYYIKGIPRAARTKVALVEAETLDEMNDIFDRFAEQTAERAAKRQQA